MAKFTKILDNTLHAIQDRLDSGWHETVCSEEEQAVAMAVISALIENVEVVSKLLQKNGAVEDIQSAIENV